MSEDQIILQALDNLKDATGITGKWNKTFESEADGELYITINGNELKLTVEIKNELRSHQLYSILRQASNYRPFIVVATRIFPKIKEELRNLKIAYLESNGNLYLNEKQAYIWIETQKPTAEFQEKANRAFNKTGLKAVLLLLIHEEYINRPYREIAASAQVSLGNVTNIINSLKENGFVTNVNKQQHRLTNRKDLITKWSDSYVEKLKPSIKMGKFSFINKDIFNSWRNMILPEDTVWGGEPAADILTDYLRPAILTIYTAESRTEIMKKCRLIPDEKGNIEIYQKFWNWTDYNEQQTAPWLIIYAELMAVDDKRTRETAQMIYEQRIK